MNNHEHMCMDGDNLSPENRLENLKCKCFQLCRDCHICHTECHICQRHCHILIFRGTLGAGTILGGAGGSSVINSLQAYPDLIKKYQGLSKKPPELEKFGPIIELINTQNMKPAQVKMLRKSVVLIFFSSDVFWKMHRRGLPCPPSLCQQNWGMCPKVRIFFSSLLSSSKAHISIAAV